ncbi:phosphoglycolate phosphatase [Spongiibacter sp. KMU-158]|uniref:Phosphoglycolate phosphatase n=1 Tax=Spongiibacter pelagi TaxID=2760804 RepID=A0A927C2W0_9GAMM|nr:phosphoglycolate phosphatase [Spongiibacter pelagi]MBD2858626.1 phosphoglycolate phosphatase [Spongiibacter pelagi]
MKLAGLLDGRPLKALLFDLDGTLVDSVPDIANALDRALLAEGYAAAGEERARAWVGNGAGKLVQRALAHALNIAEADAVGEPFDRLLAAFYDFYQQDSHSHTRLYTGVLEALSAWQQAGIAMACVTNKPERFTHPILAHLKLDSFMPVVIGGDTLPVRKPDPAPLLLACERLGIAAENTVMVGDSVNDVGAARALGVPVACVSYGYNHGAPVADAKPDLLVDDFFDLV